MGGERLTMTIIEPTPITQAVVVALADLADCVCTELASSGGGPTCWCGLYPGATVSWDFCGECAGDLCGMGYVRLAGVFPYSSFPEPLTDTRCTRPLGWSVDVGALRCVPTSADGSLPDPTTMSEVAINQVLDASALHRAIKCCGYDVAIEGYLPVGPQGGCVGGFWRAHLAVDG